MKRRRLYSTLGTLALLAGIGQQAQAAPARAGMAPAPSPVGWMMVMPDQPNTLYIGVELPKVPDIGDICHELPMRSTDGGATWTDLTGIFVGLQGPDVSECNAPFLQTSFDGHSAYATVVKASGGGPTVYSVFRSRDGLHWQPPRNDAGGVDTWVQSTVRPDRLYGAYFSMGSPDSGEGCAVNTIISDDGGLTWTRAGDPTTGLSNQADLRVGGMVADPRDAETVYANLQYCSDFSDGPVMVSYDQGMHWTRLAGPPGLADFVVSIDRHESGLLIAQAPSPTGDRRYLSPDQGRTWQAAACPGDLRGACPTVTVDNAFGAGQSYAFFKDGIYAFQGDGPATTRMAVSDRLPVPLGTIVDVQTGAHTGDPVYLLGKNGVLYRSADAGRSWQPTTAGILPNAQPAGSAPGALYVRATLHSVAPAFVAAYHTLGSFIVGNPVTEAYWEGTVLTQDFEHLRLELHGTTVVVANLGLEVFNQLSQLVTTADPIPNTPNQMYFPQTQHTLRGAFMRYWRQHGGLAVLGAPISEVVTARNGDGSGRAYQMQYFEHARLEYHPENRNPHFQILLGLLGDESLINRGWAVARP